MEPKYDGERILAHVDAEAKRVELYTRSAIDYTSAYGPSMRPVFLSGLLGRQAVLDGEMLAWDEDEQAFIAFGSNRTVAQMGDARKHLCFIAPGRQPLYRKGLGVGGMRWFSEAKTMKNA